MPELPEVETTRRGLSPLILDQRITQVEQRIEKLREPLDRHALQTLIGRSITSIQRRAKYLIMQTDQKDQAILIHLGMSGSLRVNAPEIARKTHDHIILTLANQQELRFHDPRRFGHFSVIDPQTPHRLLTHLGPEPLSEDFTAQYLHQRSRGRKAAVKGFIMDQKTVVGVGNIYASEALFLSGISPKRAAGEISPARYQKLVANIKTVLSHAIEQGGTTLRDFVGADGTAGYFQQTLDVYGKAGQPCPKCATPLRSETIAGRNSVWCPKCQH